MKTITIKKGRHSVFHLPRFYWKKDVMEFTVIPDKSWLYTGHVGINKIAGRSWGHHHHGTSVRLGYRCENGHILLYAYCYRHGVSPQKDPELKRFLRRCPIDVPLSCKIIKSKREIILYFNDVDVFILPTLDTPNWGYKLFPYIGGDFTLDHDVYFKFKNF